MSSQPPNPEKPKPQPSLPVQPPTSLPVDEQYAQHVEKLYRLLKQLSQVVESQTYGAAIRPSKAVMTLLQEIQTERQLHRVYHPAPRKKLKPMAWYRNKHLMVELLTNILDCAEGRLIVSDGTAKEQLRGIAVAIHETFKVDAEQAEEVLARVRESRKRNEWLFGRKPNKKDPPHGERS